MSSPQVAVKGSCSNCSARDSHGSGFADCRAQALRCLGFSSCSSWTLEHRLDSCGTQASLLHGMWDSPGPGIRPCLLHWQQVDSLPLSYREALNSTLLKDDVLRKNP